MKTFLIVIVSCVFCACGPMVYIDFEKEQDFSDFSTYQFYPDIDSGLSELDDKRIMVAIDLVLQQRGFIKSEDNRFFINFYAKESFSNSQSTLGIGVGGSGRNVGVGVSGGIPIGGTVVNQQLTIDIIDAAKDDLVWQAVVEGELKEKAAPREKETHYFKFVQKALSKFPPKK